MWNTILINRVHQQNLRGVLAIAALMGGAACSNAAGVADQAKHDSNRQESADGRMGAVPALPIANDAATATRSAVLSMEAMAEKFPSRGSEPGCFITFAYRGYVPETLIWDGEACEELTMRFGDRAFLEAYGNWDRLDSSQKEDVTSGPDGRVFYVEGRSTASIYPIGTSGLTYEVVVTD